MASVSRKWQKLWYSCPKPPSSAATRCQACLCAGISHRCSASSDTAQRAFCKWKLSCALHCYVYDVQYLWLRNAYSSGCVHRGVFLLRAMVERTQNGIPIGQHHFSLSG